MINRKQVLNELSDIKTIPTGLSIFGVIKLIEKIYNQLGACENCSKFTLETCTSGHCGEFDATVFKDDFCSYFERKDS